jgi:hypothetical protein
MEKDAKQIALGLRQISAPGAAVPGSPETDRPLTANALKGAGK